MTDPTISELTNMNWPEVKPPMDAEKKELVMSEQELKDLRESHTRLVKALELNELARNGSYPAVCKLAKEMQWIDGECDIETFIAVTIEDALVLAREVGGQ